MSKKEQKEQQISQEKTSFCDTESQTLSETKKTKKHIAAAIIAKVAILTAISWILYVVVKFPLPFLFPSFLDMQISDLPALLGGFSMGPFWGCLIVVAKCLLKMPMSSTGCVGELADILMGIAFVLPASIIYKNNKSKKGAFIGLLTGMFCGVVVAVVANRFLLIPFYVEVMFAGTIDPLVNMVSSLYAKVTADNFYAYYLGLAVVPFNILRYVICGGITFAVYKSLSKILHW